MNISEQKRELQSKIDGLLAKPHLDATMRKQVDGLLSRLADVRQDEQRAAQSKALMAELGVATPVEEESRSAADQLSAFRKYISTGRDEEIRTYTPMTTGGIPLPQPFYAAYQEQLKSFSGIREAGARIISTGTNGDALKNPFSSDTTVGELLAENATATLANPTISDTVFTSWTYSSKGVQYSANLQKDAGIDVENFLAGIFASRIGRKFNADATNGVGSGMTGIIPSITNVFAGGTTTAVGLSDLVDLQGEIDPAYLPGAVYMLNPKSARTLRKLVATDGRRVFPEMGQGMLLGYPYVLNVDMADIAASAKPVAFGNFKLGVTIREVVPTLLVSTERFAEMRALYSVLLHRMDCQLTDANAVAVLQNAAS